MFLARDPNLKVDVVSSILSYAGEQVIIRAVRAFPPSDSCNTRVSLLSL
jgi:hypothetical protein